GCNTSRTRSPLKVEWDSYPTVTHLENGVFSWETSTLSVGSGPRGRWFKSTRPDQFSKNLRKSAQFSLTVHSVFKRQIASAEPSAPYFKRWYSEELFDLPAARHLWLVQFVHSPAHRSGSNLY